MQDRSEEKLPRVQRLASVYPSIMREARRIRLLAERTALYTGADTPTNWLFYELRKRLKEDLFAQGKTYQVIIEEYLFCENIYEEGSFPEDDWEFPLFLLQHRIEQTLSHVTALASSRVKVSRIIAIHILSQSSVAELRISNQCMEELRKLLAVEKDPKIVALAVFALLRYREISGVLDLLLSFAHHPDEGVCRSVAQCLEGLNNSRAIPAVIALSNHSNYYVRLPATRGLAGAIGTLGVDALTCEALVSRLTDPAVQIRCVALEGLAKALDPRIIPALLEKRNQSEAVKKEWLAAVEAVMETLVARRAQLGPEFAPLMKEMGVWIIDPMPTRDPS